MPLHSIRSLLFVPATRLDKLERVQQSGADLYVIDLEDSVPQEDKVSMRREVAAWFDTKSGQPEALKSIAVRINALTTVDGVLDFLSLADLKFGPAAFMLPKVYDGSEIRLMQSWMEDMDAVTPIIPLFETLEVWDFGDDVLDNDLVPAVLFGGIDMAASLGSNTAWDSMVGYRRELLRLARKYNKAVIDMPWFDLNDQEGLRQETRRLRDMGFDARAAIHPDQVAMIHEGLRPDPVMVEEARELIRAFEISGAGVATYKGRVVEKPVLSQAYKLIEQSARYKND